MPRLRPIPRAEITDPLVLYVYDERQGTNQGDDTPEFWERTLACSPDVLEHLLLGIEVCNGPAIGIDALTRELLKARVGWLTGSRLVYEDHLNALAQMGATEDRIDGVPTWELASCYSETERVLLAYTDCLVRGVGRVSDELFELVRNHYSDKTVLGITYLVGYFIWVARLATALKLGNIGVAEHPSEPPSRRQEARRSFASASPLPPRDELVTTA